MSDKTTVSGKLICPQLVVGLILLISSGGFAWWILAPVMRESDQASLLIGGLELSRNFEPFKVDFYNYDKQWASYWILAGAFHWGAHDFLITLTDLVKFGNGVALIFGCLGMSAAMLVAVRGGWLPLLVMSGLLVTPVWMLSLPLLSSNIISAGFLGLWVGVMECGKARKGSPIMWLAAGLCTFLAVGSRADAAFVLPALALAWWGIGRSWEGLLQCGLLWASFFGSLGAIVIGMWMSDAQSANYAAFFKWQTFTGYFLFGLGGVVFWYLGILAFLVFGQLNASWKQRGREWVWFLCLLLPILYYGRVLYSPRHLLTSALVICFSGCFSASWVWWRGFQSSFGRYFMILGGLSLLIPMSLGIRLKSLSNGSLIVSENVTLYPSADGHWPMGNYVNFLGKLKQAAAQPIDHNQRIWGAWLAVDSKNLAEGPITGVSNGLMSYGRLWASWNDRHFLSINEYSNDRGSFFVDDRTLIRGRAQSSVRGQHTQGYRDGWGMMRKFPAAEVVGQFQGGRVLLLNDEGSHEGNAILSVTKKFRDLAGSNSFVIEKFDQSFPRVQFPPERKWIVVCAPKENPNLSGKDKYSEVWAQNQFPSNFFENSDSDYWIGWSELPFFFDVNQY